MEEFAKTLMNVLLNSTTSAIRNVPTFQVVSDVTASQGIRNHQEVPVRTLMSALTHRKIVILVQTMKEGLTVSVEKGLSQMTTILAALTSMNARKVMEVVSRFV